MRTDVVAAVLAVLLIAAGLTGCGSKKPAASAPPSAAEAGAAGAAAAAAQAAVPSSNPRFAILRPFFSQFLRKPVEGKVNIFRRNLATFAPRVDIDISETSGIDEPKTPLEMYDVADYDVTLIMSGTAMAKALLVDPRGKSYVATAGTKIGNRGGKIVSISSTEVRIEEPGRAPTIKTLEPPTDDMIRELQAVQEF